MQLGYWGPPNWTLPVHTCTHTNTYSHTRGSARTQRWQFKGYRQQPWRSHARLSTSSEFDSVRFGWVLGSGFLVLVSGSWFLDPGFWILAVRGLGGLGELFGSGGSSGSSVRTASSFADWFCLRDVYAESLTTLAIGVNKK